MKLCEINYCSAPRSCFHYCLFHHERICIQGIPISDVRCGLRDDGPEESKAEDQPQ